MATFRDDLSDYGVIAIECEECGHVTVTEYDGDPDWGRMHGPRKYDEAVSDALDYGFCEKCEGQK